MGGRFAVATPQSVGLVNRLVQRQLVRRAPSAADRRRQEVSLTASGEKLPGKLSVAHLKELRQLRPEFRQLLESRPAD